MTDIQKAMVFLVLIDSIETQSASSHTHDNTIPADSVPAGLIIQVM